MKPGTIASASALALGIFMLPSSAHAQSVNCQAKTAAARLICSDQELVRLDAQLGLALQKRESQIPTEEKRRFILQQIAWISTRNSQCGLVGKDAAPIEVLAPAKHCMAEALKRRISELSQAVPQPSMADGPNHTVTKLRQEMDALRLRIRQCWKTPEGADSTSFVVLRIQFKKDGTLAHDPTQVAGSTSATAPALAESGKRALRACQPFTMLRAENYDQWKDIQIRFDAAQFSGAVR